MSAIVDQTPNTAKSVIDLFVPNHDPVSGEETIECDGLNEKTVLVSPSSEQYVALENLLKQRLRKGHGEVIYEIGTGGESDAGLTADQMDASVATLQSIAARQDCDCVRLRERKATEGLVAEYLVRRRAKENDFVEVRVAVVGNVDAGKSTLLGVLTHGELDNGRGLARQRLFRHKHEAESGRTSSVGNDILGFDSRGNVVNQPDPHGGQLDWMRICEQSSKVITFIDLAGHERYLKTTIFGMTGHAPDFTMLMVGMTKEHLGLALALSVPVFVVVTKMDMCPANVLQDTMRLLVRILKSPGCRKIPVVVHSADDVVVCATNFVSERLCPIFQVSNVTGENLLLLKMFLNLLSTRMPNLDSEPAEFQVDDTYSVPGKRSVLSTVLLSSSLQCNMLVHHVEEVGGIFGAQIVFIHEEKYWMSWSCHQFLSQFVQDIRKGMVLVSPKLEPKSCWEFEGEILVLHHPTTISPRYQAMVHCGSIRQTASILSMSTDCLRTGDKALVRFRFIKNPEYLRPGMRLVFREGRTKAVGNVLRLFPPVPGGGHYHGVTKAVASKPQQQARNNSAPTTSENNGDTSPTDHPTNDTTSSGILSAAVPRAENEPQKASKRNRGRYRGPRMAPVI
ncbi:hypothetical protein HPB50_009200 [Hyalomma asiaticum]|uniref:Uncharacterized protein n=1 Tax=Hyalomma asiaticum TaxID=266040 RepID=A0ACB7T9I6_HYAAI|nr:hypothetical protein HPB50_009200 [Hyalomma asiaticum]